MNNILKLLLIGILALINCSCTTHKMSFDCKAGKGVGCQSLSTVNELVNTNSLDKEIAKHSGQKSKPCINCVSNAVSAPQPITLSKSGTSDNSVKVVKPLVMRSSEKVMQVWLNGYLDKAGNYKSEQYLYTVIEPAAWIVR